MWSIFSRDPTKDFPFEIGESVSGLENQSIWNLHTGKRKSNGEEVSVFVFDLTNHSDVVKQTASASVKRLKTLRHPNVLTFIDSLETEKFIYMVTEPVVPLSHHIKADRDGTETSRNLAISWGLHQVIKGLSFIINTVNLIHNNVCMSSMFVDKAGEWKLGGIDYMYPASGEGSNVPPLKTLPELEKYDSPEKNMKNRMRKSTKWSQDMWGVGCLIWEVFNGVLPRSSSLKVLGKIPKNLVTAYCELVSANPSTRPDPEKFIENCKSNKGFMDNHFIKTNLFLEEIQIKDPKETLQFFSTLTKHLDDFPPNYSRHKILPQLLNAFQFGNAGSSVLAPLFKLGALLGPEEYQQKIVPCVIKLFTSTDRATRINLLQQLPLFVEHLQPQVVNTQVFPNIVTGFMDSNPAIREQSIKAILLLAPKLNDNNLNNELMKHFARLQSRDDQGPIRTNTTICLGKIVPLLSAPTRQKVVSSAFMRAMRDPFPAARSAGVMGMANTIQFFSLADCAHKALPTLCSLTVDTEKQVRDQAFKTIKLFIDKLKLASDDPVKAAEMNSAASVPATTTVATQQSGWGGWMTGGVSSITSRLYSGKKPVATGTKPTDTGKPTSGPESKPDNTSTQDTNPQPQSNEPIKNEETVDDDQSDYGDEGEGGAWKDEEWDDIKQFKSPLTPLQKHGSHGGKRSIITTSQLRAMEDDVWTELYTGKTPESDDDYGAGNNDNNADGDEWDNNGWGDEGDSEPQIDDTAFGKTTKASDSWGDWGEDDDEGNQDDSWAPKSNTNFASSYNWDASAKNTNNDSAGFFDDFSPGSKPTKKKSTNTVKSAPKNRVPQNKEVKKEVDSFAVSNDSWDTWGNDGSDNWGGDNDDDGLSKAERLKQEREQKRKERQAKLAERKANKAKGGMKLGTRKMD